MGLIQNKKLLEKLQNHLKNTNFNTQSLGHNLTLSFLPPSFAVKLQDKRYNFKIKHNLFSTAKQFNKATYSEVIVGIILELSEEITKIPPDILKVYEETGLIEDNKCTKELIGSVLANCLCLNASSQIGNTVTQAKFSDNLQNIYSEYNTKTINKFLTNLDKYKPTI